MSTSSKTELKVVFGAMTLGKAGVEMTRVHDLETAGKLLDTMVEHGHTELDTARVYGEGSSEEYLGDLDWQKRGIVMETKLYPSARMPPGMFTAMYDHTPEGVRDGLMKSLKALKADRIDLFYLHGPDRKVPFEDTLREVNKLHQEGYFKRFGVSNYYSWEVAVLCEICEKNGWIKPTVYQGLYNALGRQVEPELIPCLRKYGISLYAFNPLAGGFLTNRYHRDQTEFEAGSRFDPKRVQGAMMQKRYMNDYFYDALDILRPVAKKHGLTEAECALRWMNHHSVMKKEFGDAVIIGASSTKHLEENLVDLEKGPLPEEVVQALQAGWERLRPVELKYWH